jgi:hypothetical protein
MRRSSRPPPARCAAAPHAPPRCLASSRVPQLCCIYAPHLPATSPPWQALGGSTGWPARSANCATLDQSTRVPGPPLSACCRATQDGATAVAVWVLGSHAAVANIGDARCVLARVVEKVGARPAALSAKCMAPGLCSARVYRHGLVLGECRKHLAVTAAYYYALTRWSRYGSTTP